MRFSIKDSFFTIQYNNIYTGSAGRKILSDPFYSLCRFIIIYII